MKFEFPKIVSLDILYSCLIVIKILIKTKANEPATGKSIQELSPTTEQYICFSIPKGRTNRTSKSNPSKQRLRNQGGPSKDPKKTHEMSS